MSYFIYCSSDWQRWKRMLMFINKQVKKQAFLYTTYVSQNCNSFSRKQIHSRKANVFKFSYYFFCNFTFKRVIINKHEYVSKRMFIATSAVRTWKQRKFSTITNFFFKVVSVWSMTTQHIQSSACVSMPCHLATCSHLGFRLFP